MIKASFYSNGKKALEFVEKKDERVVKVCSFSELLRYLPPVFLTRGGRYIVKSEESMVDSEAESVEDMGKKPTRLKWGLINIRFG